MYKYMLLFLLVLVACRDQVPLKYSFVPKDNQRMLDSFIGKSQEHLISNYGTPDSKFAGNAGGQIWNYDRVAVSQGYYRGNVYRPPVTYMVRYMIFIDGDGNVTNWQAKQINVDEDASLD